VTAFIYQRKLILTPIIAKRQ